MQHASSRCITLHQCTCNVEYTNNHALLLQEEELQRLQAQASHGHSAARAARQQASDALGAAAAAREAAKRANAAQQLAQAELAELRCETCSMRTRSEQQALVTDSEWCHAG
jgi:hypothetical protein